MSITDQFVARLEAQENALVATPSLVQWLESVLGALHEERLFHAIRELASCVAAFGKHSPTSLPALRTVLERHADRLSDEIVGQHLAREQNRRPKPPPGPMHGAFASPQRAGVMSKGK